MQGVCDTAGMPGVSTCLVDEKCFLPFLPPATPLTPEPVEAFVQPQTPSATRARLESALRVPYPTLGSFDAPHEIVMFQDLRCGMCRRAFREFLPHLREHWVDTGRGRVVFVECAGSARGGRGGVWNVGSPITPRVDGTRGPAVRSPTARDRWGAAPWGSA